MKTIRWFLPLCLLTPAIAQQAPWARPDVPISSHDRVYTADQTSNTVSVIDPAENKLVGVIKLGDPGAGSFESALQRTASCSRPRLFARWQDAGCRFGRIEFRHADRHCYEQS